MNKTYEDFLVALENFRKAVNGDSSIDMEEDVVLKIIAFLKDKDNVLYVLTDINSKLIKTKGKTGNLCHVYTSLQDLLATRTNGQAMDLNVNGAFEVFNDIINDKDADAVMVNDNVYPCVYIPKDIMEMMVYRVDHEEEFQRIRKK